MFDLVQTMQQIYFTKSGDKIISNKIQRGAKSPISDLFEEEFTKFLSTVLDDKYSFIIDFPLSKYDKETNILERYLVALKYLLKQ
ncbi:MAG: hypothetical protein KBT36_14400 [Kurthia sp.]|nr:hypothetical protein [Candidatus Kurthia equi]